MRKQNNVIGYTMFRNIKPMFYIIILTVSSMKRMNQTSNFFKWIKSPKKLNQTTQLLISNIHGHTAMTFSVHNRTWLSGFLSMLEKQ